MYVLNYISKNDPDTFEKVLKEENVARLFAFGSGTFSESPNDIDLLIEMDDIDPIKRAESLCTLWDFFEGYFRKKVDLLTQESLKNPTLIDEIERTKFLIYAKEQQKIPR